MPAVLRFYKSSKDTNPIRFFLQELVLFVPFGLVENGDIITIDAEKGTIDVRLTPDQLADRKRAFKRKENNYASGALWKYVQTVGPAHLGATTHPGAQAEKHTYADI